MKNKKEYIISALLVFIICIFVVGVTYLGFSEIRLSNTINKTSYVSMIYENNKKIILTNNSILSEKDALDRATGYEILKFKVKPNLFNVDFIKYKLLLNTIVTTDEINLSYINIIVYRNGEPIIITGDDPITSLQEILSMKSYDDEVSSKFITSGRVTNEQEDEYMIKAWISDTYKEPYECENTMYMNKESCEKNNFKWEVKPITVAFDIKMIASE